MKNKLILVIILLITLTNNYAQDSENFGKQQRNKVKIIIPENEINNFDDIRSKYKIFKASNLAYKLTNEIMFFKTLFQGYGRLFL
jgi:hypothetical protein